MSDWSAVVPAPSAWSDGRIKFFPVRKPDLHLQRAGTWPVLATSLPSYSRSATLAVRRQVQVAKALIIGSVHAVARQWATLDPVNRRRGLAAVSFFAVFGAIAVPFFTGVAHSQPELESHAALSKPVTPQSLVNSVAASVATSPVSTSKTQEVKSSVVLPEAVSASGSKSPSSIALLSDVSTMDLMMPIAEPDLNIASHHSLWAQVGRESGVDPLLLYSVALVESKSLHPGGNVGPTPWLFRVNDHLVTGERHHVQMEMAVATQFNTGVQDVGIMQVYYPMHRSAVRDPLTLLDPKTNISVAAKILHDGMHETRDPVLGVGYYHSHTPQLARDYGTAVMTVYQRLKGVYRTGKHAEVVAR